MQPFRVRKDALTWFRDLYKDGSFEIGFDAFYFCFIAGITAKKKQSMPIDKTEELVDYFPSKYRSRGSLLIALFLMCEFEMLGVTLSERAAVHSTIGNYVSPDARNNLSDDGVREFNMYAHAGFEVLIDWFDLDRPRTLETFLRMYKSNLDVSLGKVGV